MQLTSYKKFALALLLLAFIGQSLASVLMMSKLDNSSVMTPDNTHMNHMNHDMGAMHHDMSSMVNMNHASHTKIAAIFDCCKTSGHCLSGTCALAATNQSLAIIFIKSRSAIEDLYSSFAPSPLASSLYRPPIFA